MTKMYQCDLSNGSTHTRAYIEEKGAVVGAKVTLKDTDEPGKLWTVDSVSTMSIDEAYLKQLKVWYRGQREASDI